MGVLLRRFGKGKCFQFQREKKKATLHLQQWEVKKFHQKTPFGGKNCFAIPSYKKVTGEEKMSVPVILHPGKLRSGGFKGDDPFQLGMVFSFHANFLEVFYSIPSLALRINFPQRSSDPMIWRLEGFTMPVSRWAPDPVFTVSRVITSFIGVITHSSLPI